MRLIVRELAALELVPIVGVVGSSVFGERLAELLLEVAALQEDGVRRRRAVRPGRQEDRHGVDRRRRT